MDLAKIWDLPDVQDFIQTIEREYRCDDFSFLDDKPYISQIDYDGATKIVFLSDSWDFVFKVAKYDCSRNYCELEMKNYQAAKEFNVQKIFLETALFWTFGNGLELYIQPKFDFTCWDYLQYHNGRSTLKRKLNNYGTKNTTKAWNGMYDSSRINLYWFSRVIQLYGKKFVYSLELFSQKQKMGDLHMSNIGWKDKKPVIFDYAGYFEDD